MLSATSREAFHAKQCGVSREAKLANGHSFKACEAAASARGARCAVLKPLRSFKESTFQSISILFMPFKSL